MLAWIMLDYATPARDCVHDERGIFHVPHTIMGIPPLILPKWTRRSLQMMKLFGLTVRTIDIDL